MKALGTFLVLVAGIAGGFGLVEAVRTLSALHDVAAVALPAGCDAEVYGACVVFETGAPALSQEKLERAFETAAFHWNTDVWAIKGWTVVVHGRNVMEVVSVGQAYWGVSFMDIHHMDFATPLVTCPEFVFVHEWGHAGAGVLGHEDERFLDDAIRETTGC